MEDMVVVIKKRGRPFGYKVSESTKDKIGNCRLGTHHSKETRDKISKSLIEYFRKRNSLSTNIEQEYGYISKEIFDWIYDNKDDIDDIDCVMTERKLSYLSQLELCLGNDIENFFGHNVTPEFLLILKEEIESIFGKDRAIELCSLL